MRILLAVDGSVSSQDAVDEVMRRPWPEHTTIRVLSVVVPYVPGASEFVPGGVAPVEVIEALESDALSLATKAADQLSSHGLSTEAIATQGDPGSAIVEAAREWAADLIVVGSHGRTGLKRLLLGSVAQAVVAKAPCSVEVARRHRKAA